MKRILPVFLSILFLFTALPLGSVLAATYGEYGDLSYTIVDGEVTITDCNENASGNLVVPDTIDSYPVTTIEYKAFYYCNLLTAVTIPESVTYIGNCAFQYCTSLTSINIPDSVTIIGWNAFHSCTALESVNIGDSVTIIGSWAFHSCTALESVTIGDSVRTIDNLAFAYCEALTSVTIPDSVTTIESCAFYLCDSLESVTIGAGVDTIGLCAFEGCRDLIVHYHGSEQDREAITFDFDNDELDAAIWHYYDHAYDLDCNACGATRKVPDYISGDANGDGKVNVRDVGLLQQYINGWEVTVVETACDVNGDGKLNVRDIGLMQQYINGWDVELLLPGVATGEMVWPVPICQNISRGYSDDHPAIDISNGPIPILDKPCVAADSGMVVYAGWYYDYGYIVKIQHTDELVTMYAHLESFAVTTGQQVTRGQTIGLVGNSGDASYAHLHFEVIKDGEKVNPLDYVMPSE